MPDTIRVTGVRETVTRLKKTDSKLPKALMDGLKNAAMPVAEESKQKIGKYRGAKLTTIRPRAKGRGDIFVTQGARKKTGKHPQYGTLQLHLMWDALEEKRPEVIRNIDRAIDHLADQF